MLDIDRDYDQDQLHDPTNEPLNPGPRAHSPSIPPGSNRHNEKPDTPSYPINPVDLNNYGTRLAEVGRFIGAPARAAYDTHAEKNTKSDDLAPTGEVNNQIEIGLITFNAGGLALGFIFHVLLAYKLKNKNNKPTNPIKRWFFDRLPEYENHQSVNPLYRNFKTLACVGAAFGASLAFFLPVSDGAKKFFSAICADIAAIVLGLFAIPYWLIRQEIFKVDPNKETRNGNHITGLEGWSKYGKTLLVFGMALGQFLGISIALLLRASTGAAKVASILWSGMAGVGLFVIGLVLIPIINKYTNRSLTITKPDKDKFRNNYIRTGMTLGLAIGVLLGAMIAVHVFPILFPAICQGLQTDALYSIGMIVGGALFSIAGGILTGVKGHKISLYTQTKWNISGNTENSWDYATRTTSMVGASVGALIGFFIPIPGGFLIGSAVGTAVGGIVGWFAALPIIALARKLKPDEGPPSEQLSWAQRVGSGANIGTVIGGLLGLIGGALGGPIGLIGGAILGSAIGGIIGAAVATTLGKEGMGVIKQLPTTEGVAAIKQLPSLLFSSQKEEPTHNLSRSRSSTNRIMNTVGNPEKNAPSSSSRTGRPSTTSHAFTLNNALRQSKGSSVKPSNMPVIVKPETPRRRSGGSF